jgi:two-component system response regulator DegU
MKTQRNGAVYQFNGFLGGTGNPIATTKPYRIILVDDHALFRHQIKRIIEEAPNLEVVGEAGDGFEALDLLKEIGPDLVILDISMPKCGGIEASGKIKSLYPDLKVLILTIHRDEAYMQHARAVGVDGYLLKEVAGDELIEAILTLMEGKTYFSVVRSKYERAEPIRGTTAARISLLK